MGWAIGHGAYGRDIGYGVPAICDQPGCNEEIDRGLSYSCVGFTSDDGCGLYFCSDHLYYEEDSYGEMHQFCDSCAISVRLCRIDPDNGWRLAPVGHEPKPDILKWVLWKLHDDSWEQWRSEYTDEVKQLRKRVGAADAGEVQALMTELEPEMEQNQTGDGLG
jgi:hypothetical protein